VANGSHQKDAAMIPNIHKSHRFTKSEFLRETPIFQQTNVCERIYHANISFADLYSHDVLEITMVTSGSGIHQILNEAIPCKEGDIYILNSDVPHGYFAAEEGGSLTVRRLLFDAGDWFVGDIADRENTRFCYGIFNDSVITAYAMPDEKTRSMLAELLDSIEQETTEKGHEWQESVRAYLSLLLITVGRYIHGAIKEFIHAKPREWGVVASVIRMVMMDFANSDLTLESIGEVLYVSKSHISRLFKQLTGETFSEYLRNIRISHACTLLEETDMTIEEIVLHCGLRDIPTFYRTFRQLRNMTPNQYRMIQNKVNCTVSHYPMAETLCDDISENLQRGKAKAVVELVQRALEEKISAQDILQRGLLHGMGVVSERFKNNRVYVPEVLVAARAMNMGMQALKPYLIADGIKIRGRVCIGTVQGDLHDIGKNLVKMMIEGKGIEVIDLGTDVSPQKFIQTAMDTDCKVICCSALLSTSMPAMEQVVQAAREAGIRDKVKIVIGGAPVSAAFCEEIGADRYTDNAAQAAEVVAEFLRELQ